MNELETLEEVAVLGLVSELVENLVDELGSLSVVTLSPVVTGLREQGSAWSEEMSGREKEAYSGSL